MFWKYFKIAHIKIDTVPMYVECNCIIKYWWELIISFENSMLETWTGDQTENMNGWRDHIVCYKKSCDVIEMCYCVMHLAITVFVSHSMLTTSSVYVD